MKEQGTNHIKCGWEIEDNELDDWGLTIGSEDVEITDNSDSCLGE